MKRLVIRCVSSIAVAIVISLLFTLLLTALTPLISNEMALGQLENDNFSWLALQSWQAIISILSFGFYSVVWLICFLNIIRNIAKYVKNRKDI